jgi:peptide/nickel transport system ATP-binding protein
VHGGILKRTVGYIYAVDGVSFQIDAGQTIGLVGESGCGKTTVGRCLLRLYEPTSGVVDFDNQNLLQLNHREMRAAREDIQMVFQDPYESLNARHTVGAIVEEPLKIFGRGTPAQRREQVALLLERVGLPKSAIQKFPHEFSGGQRQRIGIARAIALKPKLIVCDEPVSALDVSIQSQVINLLLELQAEMSLAFVFIAHDLAVVKHVSDYLAVMYLGKIVEIARAEEVYARPLHPYTQALIQAIPLPDPMISHRQFRTLKGEVPSPIAPPSGCHFHARCAFATDQCRRERPELKAFNHESHQVACHYAGKVG